MPSFDRDSLESLLVWVALRLLGRGVEHGLTVRMECERREIILKCRAGEADSMSEAGQSLLACDPTLNADEASLLRGTFFSTEEAEVVKALGSGEMSASTIAAKANVELTTRLRTLLANLTDRGVLHSNTAGYRLSDSRFLSLIAQANDSTPDS